VIKVKREKIKIVLPGEVVKVGDIKTTTEVIKLDDKLVSTLIGIPKMKRRRGERVLSVLPLKTPYIPKEGDIVIGKIVDIGVTNWLVDINSPWKAILPISEVLSKPVNVSKIELKDYLNIGDLIVARVIAFDLTRDPLLTIKESRLGKATRGLFLELSSWDWLLLKSKEKTLLRGVKKKANCNIVLGANYRVLMIGKGLEEELKALEIVRETLGRRST